MNETEYKAFVEAVRTAVRIELRQFEEEDERFFEGCLPIEVIAGRGERSLAFGPMRPVGLRDPRTGQRPHAVVQLRQDNLAGTLYNLVGFQTNIKWTEQRRILRLIPGLEEVDFVRLGQMHRNTFLNSPLLLRPTLQWRDRDDLFFAGQIVGSEGYVGSTAGGLLAGTQHGQTPLWPHPHPSSSAIDVRRHFPLCHPCRTEEIPANEGELWSTTDSSAGCAQQARPLSGLF